MSDQPIVYLLHGDDDVSITQFIDRMIEKLGDPSAAEMNVTRIEPAAFSLGKVENAAASMPFLAERRMTIVRSPLGQLKSRKDRDKFKELLERLPQSSALILVEKPLAESHWLVKWVMASGGRGYQRNLMLPKGPALAAWIQTQTKSKGGTISRQAAQQLAHNLNDNNRLALQEIEKLLAYVGYSRTIDIDDVEHLTPQMDQGNIFAMVDAIGLRRSKQALEMLHKQLTDRDPLSIFGMIIRQFRLLLLTKTMTMAGARPAEIAKSLKVRDFVARKLIEQSRNFSPANLNQIYRRLGDLDVRIKTGQIEAVTALTTLIVALTA
jgi:DNA polymerase-3 subunit delta